MSKDNKTKKKGNFIKRFFAHNDDYDVQNKELLDFAIGVYGQNNTYSLVSGWFEYFANMVLFIRPLHTGAIMWLARGWDAINNPLVGSIIDKRQSKTGDKLRPYIRYLSLPIGILSALLFVNFGFSSYGAKILYLVGIYLLWDTLYSFQDIAQWGMVARITNQPERREMAAYLGRIAGTMGGWLPGLISLVIGFVMDGLIPLTLSQLFLIFGIAFGFGGMAISMRQLKCKERAPVLPPEGGLLAGLKLIRKNKIVIALTLGSVLNCLTLSMGQIYFFQYMITLNLGGKTINGATVLFAFGLLTGLPGMIAMFFTPYFGKKLGGMRNVLLLSTVTVVVCRVIMYFIGFEGNSFYIMALLFAIMNIPSAMNGIASTALWGDSLDLVELETGQRNEGTVFAFQNFIAKISGSIAALMNGITLALLKFEPEAMANGAPLSETFIKYSWPIFALGPALGALMQFIPIFMLKFKNKDRDLISAALKEKRAKLKKAKAQEIFDGDLAAVLETVEKKVKLPY